MPNLNVNILGRDGNTRAKVTGQEELLVSIGSFGPSASGLATEATLLDVLSAVDSMRDYEVRLVVDASDVTWLEVRYWDAQDGSLGTPVYYLAGSTTPGSPALPITYINPNTYLAQIVSNTTGLATETTLAALLAAFNLEDFATETTLATVAADLALIYTNLQLNTISVANIDTKLTSVARTPNFLRPTGVAGNTPAGTFSASFASVGTANATVGGMILKPGETVNFDGGSVNNTLSSIAYDTTTAGAELIITYLS
jgi:hypothetical protein